jgi:hypothetical protein
MNREYPNKKYGAWGGNPDGRPFDPSRCAESVQHFFGYVVQCQRKPGHGDRSLFCKQHARRHPMIEETP